MAKFRSGTAPIRLETERFENIPEGNRLCVLCESQQVETEIHTLIECPAFRVIRATAFMDFTTIIPGFENFNTVQKLSTILSNGLFSQARC